MLSHLNLGGVYGGVLTAQMSFQFKMEEETHEFVSPSGASVDYRWDKSLEVGKQMRSH